MEFALVCFMLLFVGMGTVNAAPITFSNVEVNAIKDTSAVIHWDMDNAASGQVEYGLDTSYGSLTGEKGLSYFHSIKVTGIAGGITYHYRIIARDMDNNETISNDYTFTTRTQAELEALVRAARTNGDLPKIYYVKTDGDDTKDGLSIENAWQSPVTAAQQAEAGDTIYLIDGTWYNENVVFANSGIDTHPITITAYDGTPTLDGVDKTGIGIEMSHGGVSFLDITGNIIVKNYEDGIYLSGGSSHINITDLKITSLDGWGIYTRPDTHYINMDNNEITHTGSGGAIITHLAGHYEYDISHITITNDILDDNNHDAINIFGNNKYVLIENNSISHATNGAGIMVHNSGNTNITIRNNTVVDSTRGIWLIGLDGCLVEGNTILNSHSHYGILIYTFTFSLGKPTIVKNVLIRNNIIENSSLYDIFIYPSTDEEISNILFENNSITELFKFDGNNISNITIRNIADADAERTIEIDDPVSNLQVEFTNGRTFKLNGDAGGHTNATLTGTGTYTIEVEDPVTGTISGTVTDDDTGLAIEGAIVSDGTRSDTTNGSGEYTINNVPVGTYTVTCTKEGYDDTSEDNVVVIEDATTTVNFQLERDTTPPVVTLKTITVNGSVDDETVTEVDINGISVPVSDNTYSHEVDVSSTDTITIIAENGDGKTVTRTITIK